MDPHEDSPWSMNLRDAIRYLRAHLSEMEKEESSETRYRTRLWEFVRMLRGHPELHGLKAREALSAICNAVKQSRGDDEDPWFGYLKFSEDDEVEFLTTWDKVNFPPGVDLLNEAVERAKLQPLVPEGFRTRRNAKYEEFISLAGHLQNLLGPQVNICLPCEKIAEILGVNKSMISRYRDLAKMDGYIEEMVPYQWSSSGNGKATEFQFHTDRFPVLQEPLPTDDQDDCGDNEPQPSPDGDDWSNQNPPSSPGVDDCNEEEKW